VSEPAHTPPTTLSARARELLDAPRFAVVATLNPDGSPLQAVVWYFLRGDEIVFNSAVGRRWPANLARDPQASVMVADEYRYVELTGRVEIDDDPERGYAMIESLALVYEKDSSKLPALLPKFRAQRRVTFRLTPDRILEHFED
jgi:PPOX class probable F420-dependent enzyme